MSRRRILFVDDDELILRMAAVTLRRLGHESAGAANLAAALEAYRAASPPFDLVICDVRLDTESGHDVARRLRALDPAARVLLVSGAPEPGGTQQAREAGALDLLPKTQVMTDLASVLARILGD